MNNSQYHHREQIALKDVIIGKDYWVINGYWRFTVKNKTSDGVLYYCHYTDKINLMPYDCVVFLEEYVNQ